MATLAARRKNEGDGLTHTQVYTQGTKGFKWFGKGECKVRAIAIRHPSHWEGLGVEKTLKTSSLRGRSILVEETVVVRDTTERNVLLLKKKINLTGKLSTRLAQMVKPATNTGKGGGFSLVAAMLGKKKKNSAAES